ncbi:MAG: hypothetical protein ACYTG3_12830 [Planctomycetota bacterium]|jgi:hypothetical protein
MSKFAEALAGLAGKKVRFFLGGGEKGFVQGPVKWVDGDRIVIQKEGEIRGTMHTISIRADQVRYFEIDTLVK